MALTVDDRARVQELGCTDLCPMMLQWIPAHTGRVGVQQIVTVMADVRKPFCERLCSVSIKCRFCFELNHPCIPSMTVFIVVLNTWSVRFITGALAFCR